MSLKRFALSSCYVTIYSTSEERLLHRIKCIFILCYVLRRYLQEDRCATTTNNSSRPAPRAAGPTPTTSRRPPAPWRRHDALPRSRPPAAVAARICGADDRATGLSKADATDDRLALGDHEKRHQRQSLLTFFTLMMLPTPPRDGLLNKITMH